MNKKKIIALIIVSLIAIPVFSFAYTGIGLGASYTNYGQFKALQSNLNMDFCAGFDIGNFAGIYGILSPIYQFDLGKHTSFVSIPQFGGLGAGIGLSVLNSNRFRISAQQVFEIRNLSFFDSETDNGFLSVLKTSVIPRFIIGKDYDVGIFLKISYAYAKNVREWSGVVGVSCEI